MTLSKHHSVYCASLHTHIYTHTRAHTRTHTHARTRAHTHTHLGRPSIWTMPFCREAADWIMVYQRGGLCEGCFGRVVIHLCRAMSWLRWKDRLHVSQVKGCQEVSPSVGCFPLLAALLVALLCSSSCSLLLVLFSRPPCHFCLYVKHSQVFPYSVPPSRLCSMRRTKLG